MAGTGMTAGTAVAGVMGEDVAGDVAEEEGGGLMAIVFSGPKLKAIFAFLFPFRFSPHLPVFGSPTCTKPAQQLPICLLSHSSESLTRFAPRLCRIGRGSF